MKKIVFCVDSDGCAMDTMTIKHELFFAPIAVKIFKIENEDEFINNWHNINLYSKTRGVNRFVGLLKSLESINYPNITNLKNWIQTTDELSNNSLKKEIDKNDYEDLKLTLQWSIEVNEQIPTLEGKDFPFKGVKETLEIMSKYGDIVIVSSANKEAVNSEWKRHNLLNYVKDVYCQDRGKKEDVIKSIVDSGVSPKNIFMIGDSPGDLDAANKNNVWFYPILVGKETESWHLLKTEVLDLIISNKFDNEQQKKYNNLFFNNLDN